MTDTTATSTITDSAEQDSMAEANDSLDALWSRHHGQWRDSAQVTSNWDQAGSIDPDLLDFEIQGSFFEVLANLKVTLLITREYEHLLLAISVENNEPRISFFNMPHPSGLAVDRERGLVYVASTRNPNQVFELAPTQGALSRLDVGTSAPGEKSLVPVGSNFYPGCLYMHDLAVIDGELYANSVGQNAIVKLGKRGRHERVWWPSCIEKDSGPVFGQNHIQLNSIAAGDSIKSSFFSASSTDIEALRPGDPAYPVDGRGVVFSGATREPVITGLTRPHSARLFKGPAASDELSTATEKIFVDNSGYGEFGYGEAGKFEPVAKLPGWTRGLSMLKDKAFVGTSRVIPRFAQYAPGLDVNRSVCGIHAVDIESGDVLGSLTWPRGNQIFAIEWVPNSFSCGFPFAATRREEEEKLLFYTYVTDVTEGE